METVYSRTLVNLLGEPLLLHLGDNDDETKRFEPTGCFTARPPARSQPQVTRMGAIPVVCYNQALLAEDERALLERYGGYAVVVSERAVVNLMAAARHVDWKPLNVAILSVDARTRHGLTLLGAVVHARRLELHGIV